MEINRNNYEIFFLDYIEGQLDMNQTAELMCFLGENPDLEQELQGFENIDLISDKISFEAKASLRKPDGTLRPIEQLCIQKLEGDLSPEESSRFDQILSVDSRIADEYQAFKKTRLVPDNTIVYADKSTLRKDTKRKLYLHYIAPAIAAAASVLITISVYINMPDDISKRKNQLSDNVYTTQREVVKTSLPGFTLTPESNIPPSEEATAVVENNIISEQPEAVAEELSGDLKARNIYANTTVILSGSMFFAYGDALSGIADGLKDAFAKINSDNSSTEDVDKQIAALPAEILSNLEQMKFTIDSAFQALKDSNEVIYDKMFNHEIMKEGIAITEKHELPAAFKPLTENFTNADINRYILKIAVSGKEDKDEPVLACYKEVFEWMQKVGEAYSQDPDISAYMESMRAKK